MSMTATLDAAAAQILIAEDSATQAQRLQHILEQHGYRVTGRRTDGSALEAASATNLRSSSVTWVMPE